MVWCVEKPVSLFYEHLSPSSASVTTLHTLTRLCSNYGSNEAESQCLLRLIQETVRNKALEELAQSKTLQENHKVHECHSLQNKWEV